MRELWLAVVRSVASLAGLVLFSLPASGQSRFLSGASASSASQPGLPSAIHAQAVAPRPSLGERSPRLLAQGAPVRFAPGTSTTQTLTLRMAGSFEEVRTPFLNQVRVPLISIGSGRLQLSGFQSVTPMENLVWGLPPQVSAAGGTPARQCQPGIRPPSKNRSYGMSLRLRFSKPNANKAGNGLWSGTRRAASLGWTILSL